jgi:Tat protein secretion system quality control protein TatD with DNase activity
MYNTPKVTSYRLEVFLHCVEDERLLYNTIKKNLTKFMPWFLNHRVTTVQHHFADSQAHVRNCCNDRWDIPHGRYKHFGRKKLTQKQIYCPAKAAT